MDEFLGSLVETWVALMTLTLARITSFMMTFPLFRSSSVPRMVKVAIAMVLSVTWLMHAPQLPELSFSTRPDWFSIGLLTIREVFVGALMGFGLGLFLIPAKLAGAYIAQEMGLSMAMLANPSTGESTSVVGELFVAISMIVFLIADIHLVLFSALVRSLDRFPVGGGFATENLILLSKAFSESQGWGLQVAAPTGAVLFLLTVTLSTLMRVNPQFNLFTFGTAIRAFGGLLALFVFVPETVDLMYRVFLNMQSTLQQLGL